MKEIYKDFESWWTDSVASHGFIFDTMSKTERLNIRILFSVCWEVSATVSLEEATKLIKEAFNV